MECREQTSIKVWGQEDPRWSAQGKLNWKHCAEAGVIPKVTIMGSDPRVSREYEALC